MNPSYVTLCQTCSGTRRVIEPEREGTFLGRLFKISAKDVACRACSTVSVRGVRTHCITALKSIVPVLLECRLRDGKPDLFVVEGGPTGSESAGCDAGFLQRTRLYGWNACAGCGRYDALFIPAKEMRRGLSKLGLA